MPQLTTFASKDEIMQIILRIGFFLNTIHVQLLTNVLSSSILAIYSIKFESIPVHKSLTIRITVVKKVSNKKIIFIHKSQMT